MEIITNHQPRPADCGMYFGASLRQKLLAEFDYLSEEEFDAAEFFQYRGVWYHVGEFLPDGMGITQTPTLVGL